MNRRKVMRAVQYFLFASNDPRLRLSILIAAAFIFYFRMPATFVRPQFWAEDGHNFFFNSHVYGWQSFFISAAGYLCTAQRLIAVLASFLPASAAPAIYSYSAIFLTLLVVWLATSPRFSMPARPVAALAVVCVPPVGEILGCLANIQWILPIGAIIILFMRSAKSSLILMGEVFFLFLTSLSGPFSLILAPLFFLRLMALWENRIERRRLIILTAVLMSGAITQGLVILNNRGVADTLSGIVPTPYSWTLWITIPFYRLAELFSPAFMNLFKGNAGVVLGLIVGLIALILANRPPFRLQKMSMLFFGFAIMYLGMLKYRNLLSVQENLNSHRYFYSASVFLVWFVCCVSANRKRLTMQALALLIAMAGSVLTVNTAQRESDDFEWRIWANFIPSGLSVNIPINPLRWYISMPAAANGPLAHFAPHIGKRFNIPVEDHKNATCAGGFDKISPLINVNAPQEKGRWSARGWADMSLGAANLDLIAIVDSQERILGYAFPGFRHLAEDQRTDLHNGWAGDFSAESGTSIRAYGIYANGDHACRLAGEHFLPESR